MSDTNDDAVKADADAAAAEVAAKEADARAAAAAAKKQAADKAASDKLAADAKIKADADHVEAARVAALPVPIDFMARDRFHAITHVTQHLWGLAGEVKADLLAALEGMTHLGPVHVQVPAPPVTPGTRDTTTVADPTKPDDGAFAVKPVSFVQV